MGALYVRKGTQLAPLAYSAAIMSATGGRAPRTCPASRLSAQLPNLPAARLAAESERLAALRDRLENAVLERIPAPASTAAARSRTPNTSNMYFDGIDGEALVIALDLRGFAVSTGSACSSGAITPSHVLTAMGLSADRARSSLRFSLGRSNTAEQVDALVEALEASVAHLRRISGTCLNQHPLRRHERRRG